MSTVAYLLLFTFYTPQLSQFGPAQIQAINASPYNGVAVPLQNQFDTSPVSESAFASKIAQLKSASTKQIWPIVYLNRIVGCTQCRTPAGQAYFGRIKMLDLDNSAGSLQDFYAEYRTALRVAHALGSPGIVVDPEPYNNESATVQSVSQQLGITPGEVGAKLQAIGSRLADLTAQEYPSAVVWFLYTGLSRLDEPANKRPVQLAAYVARGMLQTASDKRLAFKLLSGGELHGYCFSSLQRLQQITQNRRFKFRPILARYPNLALAGTIALWNNPASRRGWMLRQAGEEAECGKSGNLRGADFVPYIHYLTQVYGYVWVYAAGAADYNPYSANAGTFNNILRQAEQK